MAETGANPPNHLGTDVPSGQFDEKREYNAADTKDPVKQPPVEEDEEEDEDIDALIEELESQDANIDPEDEDEQQAGAARNIPEELLQTDTRIGLTSQEVTARRKKYGLNQMKEEKENLILKFIMYFVGPIQFVMEAAAVLAAGLQVSSPPRPSLLGLALTSLPGLGRFRCHLRPVAAERRCRFHPRIPGWFHCRRTEEDPRPQGHRSPRRSTDRD
jgi:hypothetical protein